MRPWCSAQRARVGRSGPQSVSLVTVAEVLPDSQAVLPCVGYLGFRRGPAVAPCSRGPVYLSLLWPPIGCSHDGHAPRRRSARGSGRSHRRRRGRHHQRGAGPCGPGHPGRRRASRPFGAAARRRQGRDRDPQERGLAGPGRALAGAPRHRPRAGGGGHGAVPRREDLDRPPDRRRLLLRLRVPRGRQAQRRGLRADRGRDAQAHQGRRALHARGRAGGRGAGALPRRGPGLQGRADRGPGPRPGSGHRVAVHQRPLHRPVPRARTPRPPSGSRPSS